MQWFSSYTKRVENLENYHKEDRPWGEFEQFTLNEKTTVKIITVQAGEALSLQTHEHRAEFWRILSGEGAVEIAGEKKRAQPGDMFYIPQGHEHRVEGVSTIVFLEIAFGEFAEADITRLEDKYGRT